MQSAELEVDLVDELFLARRGRRPLTLREDFSGTALVARQFVTGHPERRAWAVDLDPEPHAWTASHGLPALPPEARARLALVQGDAREVGAPLVPPVDVTLAMNYSCFVFRSRPEMRRYLARAREGLAEGGALVIEAVGGPELQVERVEGTQLEGFTYLWDRMEFDPITQELRCAIHFTFPDGSMLEQAFHYHWRLWTLRELRELLDEVGFASSEVYWEGAGEQGEGDGVWVAREAAPAEQAWTAYLVAWR